MWSSSIRSEAQESIAPTWILLANYDRDAVKYVKRSEACQIYVDFIHQPPELLHPTVASWPFEAWGIDIIGPISPPSAKCYRFILATTNNFLKWAEAIPLVEVKTTNVVNFIRQNVIHQFGVPRRITHDNGPQFASQSFYWFCDVPDSKRGINCLQPCR